MIPAMLARLLGGIRSATGAVIGPLASRIRRDPKRSGSVTVVGVGVVALIIAIALADGFRSDSYDLQDSLVWVVNNERSEFGRVNAEIFEMDGTRPVTDTGDAGAPATLDVAQDGNDVYVRSTRSDQPTWRKVDAAELLPSDEFTFGQDAQVSVSGGRFAVLNAGGELFVTSADDGASLGTSPDSTGESDPEDSAAAGPEPVETFGDGAVMQVGRTGTVAVADPASGSVTSVDADGTASSFDADLSGGAVQVSLAGSLPVALAGDTLWLPGGTSVSIEGSPDTAKLQLPSDDNERVLVASDTGVWSYPADGGRPTNLAPNDGAANGTVAPVRVGDCIYGAWPGKPVTFLRWCGDGTPDGTELTAYPAGSVDSEADGELVLRVNRSRVVLNDVADGQVVVFGDGKPVDVPWRDEPDDLDCEEDPLAPGCEEDDPEETLTFEPEDNVAPVAEDDRAGARPGLPTIVSVLANDTDENNDVLTVLPPENVVGGRAELVSGGQAVQVEPANGARQVQFTYKAFDGQEESDEATVVVTVFGSEVQSPPELRDPDSDRSFVVGARSSASYQVLDDWVDPEGDPLVLTGSEVPDDAGGRSSTQPDGLLTYLDEAGQAGPVGITVTVQDAPVIEGPLPLNATGEITAQVTADGQNSPPVARNDFASTAAGEPVVVWPLRNDTDPDGDELRFTLLPKEGLPSGVVDNGDGSVTVTPAADAMEPVLFGYEVSDGAAGDQARIRVDVVDTAASSLPTAGLDVVVVPPPSESGRPGTRTQDLLLNDFSPTGKVLVVTGVKPDGGAVQGLEVQLVEHRRLRVSFAGRLDRPALLTYDLSDGENQVVGRIVVVSADTEQNLAPFAVDDAVTVRAGDLVSVPVLANDQDPEGAALHLQPELPKGPGPGQGVAFVSGPRLRFLAPDRAGTIDLTYAVADDEDASRANVSTARLRITVRDSSDNSAPAPLPVEARVLAGSKVRITLPLSGIDPDGDSVSLVGLGFAGSEPSAPKLGRIVDVGVDTLTYEAFDDVAGTDEFRYRVVDSGGPDGEPLSGEATIRIGVAPRPDTNQSPVPLNDQFEVAPDSTVVVDPLLNDYDPDGDPIQLADREPLFSPTGGMEAQVVEGTGRVRLTVPDEQGVSFSVGYRIQDELGDTANGSISVVADPRAEGRPPIARDDLADPEPDASTVQVPVLLNDEDPDGDPSKLRVSPVDGLDTGVEVIDQTSLSIALTGRTQVVPYQITDEQGLSAIAVVRVPPVGESVDLPPRLKDDIEPIPVRDGQPVTVQIAEYVEDPEGAEVFIESERVTPARVAARVLSATELEVSAPTIESGSASVSVVVTDAPEGEQGRQAVVTLPVEVTSEQNQPPRWRQGLEIQVSLDEDEVWERDLARLVEDPDGDDLDLSFEAPEQVRVVLEGTVLSVAIAADGLTVGTQLDPVVLTVSDPEGASAERAFPVTVIDTSKPLPVVPPQRVEAQAGKETPVDVLAQAINPFDDTPLSIVGGSVNVNDGSGQADASGSRVLFTPDEDFVGTAVVTFEVQDKVLRRVPGTVTYTVRSTPGAPGRPTARQLSASSVEVSWSAARDNDSPIEGYAVSISGGSGGERDCGTALSCVIDRLTPGTSYTFTVVATNGLGPGERSEPSASIRPDECAGPPPNVELVFDAEQNPPAGGRLIASWGVPQNDGTRIEGYVVRVVPPPSTPVPELVLDETLVIDGLANGVAHSVTVQAQNQCEGLLGEASESTQEIPAGVPDAPGAVQAVRIDDRAGGRVQVSWVAPTMSGAPSANGHEVQQYVITEVNNRRAPETVQPASLATLAGGRVAAELRVDKNLEYQFQVSAINKAGSGTLSNASERVIAESVPDRITGVAAAVADGNIGLDRRVRLEFTEPDSGSDLVPIERYEYQIGGGTWTPFGPAALNDPAQRIVGGLTNGTSYTFQVRACNRSGCADTSPNSPAAIPYGPVPSPSVSSDRESATSVSFSWSAPSPPNGRPYVRAELDEGGGFSPVGLSGSIVRGNDYDQPFTIRVRLVDEAGQVSTAVPASRSTDPRPPPTVSIDWGGPVFVPSDGSCNTGCRRVVGSVANFQPNTTYTVQCRNNQGSFWTFTFRTTGSGGGGWGADHCWYGIGSSNPVYVRVGGVDSNRIWRNW